jgi:hypothetical protein
MYQVEQEDKLITLFIAITGLSFVMRYVNTVDSRLSARGLTALRLNRGNVFLKKKTYFP